MLDLSGLCDSHLCLNLQTNHSIHDLRIDFTIRHLHVTSPTIHLVCPPKFCITFHLNFSWVLQSSQQKLRTMLKPYFIVIIFWGW